MLQTSIQISVIICAFTEKRWEALKEAIESVGLQTLPVRDLIVVIDHNQPMFERAHKAFPNAIVIENSRSRGLSGARNSGIAAAHGNWVAFLDDDAVARPDWLERLHTYFKNPQVMGVGGSVIPRWLSKQPAWFPEEFYWVVGCSYRGLPETSTTVRNLYGGCTCIRMEVFETVGGFRDGIGRVGTVPKGCEETELCIRAKQHWPEKSFIYEPGATIQHLIPAERTRWGYFRARCYAEGCSKAEISQFIGAKDGLSTERSYTLRTLPQGVLAGVKDFVFRRDAMGLARAFTIVAGLLITSTGFVIGSLRQRMKKRSSSELASGVDSTVSTPLEVTR